jgi:hypothetical protein
MLCKQKKRKEEEEEERRERKKERKKKRRRRTIRGRQAVTSLTTEEEARKTSHNFLLTERRGERHNTKWFPYPRAADVAWLVLVGAVHPFADVEQHVVFLCWFGLLTC